MESHDAGAARARSSRCFTPVEANAARPKAGDSAEIACAAEYAGVGEESAVKRPEFYPRDERGRSIDLAGFEPPACRRGAGAAERVGPQAEILPRRGAGILRPTRNNEERWLPVQFGFVFLLAFIDTSVFSGHRN